MSLRSRISDQPGGVGGDQSLLGTQRQLVSSTHSDREHLVPATGARQGFEAPGGAGLRDLDPTQSTREYINEIIIVTIHTKRFRTSRSDRRGQLAPSLVLWIMRGCGEHSRHRHFGDRSHQRRLIHGF